MEARRAVAHDHDDRGVGPRDLDRHRIAETAADGAARAVDDARRHVDPGLGPLPALAAVDGRDGAQHHPRPARHRR